MVFYVETELLKMKIRVWGIRVVLSRIGWWFWSMLVPDLFLSSIAHLSVPTFDFISWMSIAPDRVFYGLIPFITVYSYVKEIFELEQSPLIGKKVLYGIGWVRSRETHLWVPPIWVFADLPSLLWFFGHTQTPYRKSFSPAGVGLTA